MPDILDNFRFYSQKLAIWPVFGNRKERLAQLCRAILAEMSAAYAIFVLANEGIARTKTLSLPQKNKTSPSWPNNVTQASKYCAWWRCSSSSSGTS